MADARYADTDYAWAAGFMDGEGCFTLIRRTGKAHEATRCPYVGATQIRRQPLDRLCAMFGGAVHVQKVTKGGNTVYQWQVHTAALIREMVPLLLPYLTIKKREAEIVLAYAQEMDTRRNRRQPYTEEQATARMILIDELKAIRNG
jgi:hypothetical protein